MLPSVPDPPPPSFPNIIAARASPDSSLPVVSKSSQGSQGRDPLYLLPIDSLCHTAPHACKCMRTQPACKIGVQGGESQRRTSAPRHGGWCGAGWRGAGQGQAGQGRSKHDQTQCRCGSSSYVSCTITATATHHDIARGPRVEEGQDTADEEEQDRPESSSNDVGQTITDAVHRHDRTQALHRLQGTSL